ncbi:HlyD family type I secretion periplasmic adaptor subunit [Sabulicella glaciei]|uniref:Membrane fusion protein (MFP) family protein n=1 Tax=Sabulicella glaciei TaxID=2984948 RepID=A0ABT3NSG8_9PROT|nr:HlyD family type I secretion periplasmic adaptor subunit [Roseococcus sp. MDT2-1-1]MCW8085107.1 HlyD family type I secretion periplasmic adaptor subunit [Roseococcus sp. MDT2-1-1]
MNQIASRPPRAEEPRLSTLEFVSPTAAEVARRPAPFARSVILVLFGLFCAIGAVFALMPMDRVVTTSGRLVPTVPTLLVQPLEASILRSFNVQVNQVVRQGDVIARLDPTFVGADLASLRSQEATLAAEVARLEAEAADLPFQPGSGPAMALQAAIFAQRQAERDFRTESLRQRAGGLRESITRIRAEIGQLNQRLQIASQIETMRRDLERQQVGSRLNALIAVDSRLEIQRNIAASEGMLRTATAELAAATADLSAFQGNWRTQVSLDLAQKRRELADVHESLTKTELRHELVEMRAPRDGVVLEIGKSSVGAVLSAGEMLVTMVPLDAKLEVEVAVEPRDMGHVAIGDRAALKFESFPFIRHGLGRGRVLNIAQDTTQPTQAANAPHFYRARLSIDELQLRNLPADFRLLPGMPLQADIVVGQRTILRYFFERALPTLVQGMREP